MKIIKKIYTILEKIFELYMPMLAFIILFCLFDIGIFARYVLKNPIIWSNEVISICFLWLVMGASCLAQKRRTHVKFTVLYDSLPHKWAVISAMLGNVIILVILVLSFVPTMHYIEFMHSQTTSMLKLPFSFVNGPYILFLVFMIIHFLQEIIEQVMDLMGKKPIDEESKEDKS